MSIHDNYRDIIFSSMLRLFKYEEVVQWTDYLSAIYFIITGQSRVFRKMERMEQKVS